MVGYRCCLPMSFMILLRFDRFLRKSETDEGFGKSWLEASPKVGRSVLRWLTWESETYLNGD